MKSIEEDHIRKVLMRAFFWRVLYAAVCFVLFWWIFPLFLDVLKVHPPSSLVELVRVCTAAIAILYVLFGPEPSMPF